MSSHQSVHDYIAARQAGDTERCAEIVAEVRARYDTRTTDGTELSDLLDANLTHPLATS
ncbi:hypothetical protein [Kitasatospora sp. A2-31]|uniref:hypothetical protein n=1 Tax=Kitasatospora sp. A2-31 TaxID=2916414 RepID=UPI001EEC4689|nr:hypothetical protein [Kitasatospora sp. A2-31]MCG6497632.1 hypothetical protein [Kitasatospora sp. A2-31]